MIRFSLSTALVFATIALLSAGPAGAAVPSFTVAPGTTVPAGTSVTFTSNSAEDPAGGPITAWDWNFSDGSTASGSSVTRTFTTTGEVSVTLTVTDGLGPSLPSAPTTITVTRRPTVSFSVRPSPGIAGEPVTFRPTASTAPGETITSASWTFGDGNSATGPLGPVSQSYAKAGTYPVAVTVTDSRGLTAQATRNFRVHTRPTAAFSVLPAEPRVGQEVLLSSTSSDPEGDIEEHRWDLDGDGAFDDASGRQVSGAFTTPGPHAVGLRVRDEDGATATTSQIVNVKDSSWLVPITPAGDVKTSAPPPPVVTSKPFLRLLTPFPIVRLAGWRTMTGARIEILGVRAPAGSRVLVKCRGKKCPVKKAKRSVSAKKPKPVRLPRFQRFFPAGSVIEVFVRRSGRLGKYTRFRIRAKRKRWRRMDGCVAPDTTRAVTCPAD